MVDGINPSTNQVRTSLMKINLASRLTTSLLLAGLLSIGSFSSHAASKEDLNAESTQALQMLYKSNTAAEANNSRSHSTS